MKNTAHYFGRGYYQIYRHYLLPEAQTRVEAEFLLRELRPRPGARWLDLPCGYGRHLEQLRALRPDLQLFGGDLNRAYLRAFASPDSAAIKGAAACDMRRPPFAPRSFHVILNLLNSFGYHPPARRGPRRRATDGPDDQAALAAWARLLRPRGRLVMDLPNRRALIGLVRRNPVIRYCGGEYEVFEQFEWDPEAEVLGNETVWRWPGGTERAGYRLRLYTPAQIARLLEGAGFAIRQVYGDFRGSAFDPHESERMLIFASL